MRGLIEVTDIPWAAWRLTRTAYSKARFNALPIRAEMEIALLRGRIHAAISRVPTHVRENIATMLGDRFGSSAVEHIARGYVRFSKRAYLAQILPQFRDFDNPRRWPVEGLEYLDDALSGNRGAILTTAHLGYARLIAPILGVHGYEVKQVIGGAGRFKQSRKEEELLAKRSDFRRWINERTRVRRDGSRDIVANLDVRPIFETISRNQAVVFAADGMRALEFARPSLLGKIYPLPTGFMKIAMQTEAPVLPVFAIDGDRRNRIRVEIHPPLEIDPTGGAAKNVQLFADVLERQIQRTPHLWNRWKIRNLLDKVFQCSESDVRLRYDARWKRAAPKSRVLE
jgi:lauroyl/myristoyl acyltransferase